MPQKNVEQKLVYDAHELEVYRNPPLSTLQKCFVYYVQRKYGHSAAEVITVGDMVGEVLAKHLGRADINIVYNSPIIKACQRHLRDELEIDASTPLVVYVGKVTSGRGIIEIVRLLTRMNSMVLAAVGPCDETQRKSLQRTAERLGVDGRFRILPPVPFDEVVDYIRGADLGVISVEPITLSYQYCMPNKLFELAFAGVPIISNDLDDIAKFLRVHQNGEIVDFKNRPELIYKVATMIGEKGRYLTTGSVLESMRMKYSWEAQAVTLSKIYQRAHSVASPLPCDFRLVSRGIAARGCQTTSHKRYGVVSICSTYLSYLDHFGPTQPVRALRERPAQADLLALRHDVDHDLDVALEMAWLEHEHGCRSTYYLLHNHSYAEDEFFLERCLQLQALGHEVGVHNDAITAWISAGTPVADSLTAFCGRLRGAGVEVLGTSTHGAKECYTHGYLNSWCFQETRAAAQEAKDAFNAEGLPEHDSALSIRPPSDGQLKLVKRVLHLWTIGLADLGLTYETGLLQQDRYFTDSGGSWSRSADPLDVDLRHGRSQVLMHPEWWTKKPRTYFFLSTARSGSKWLAGLLRDTTSATVKHEFSLNHKYASRTLQPVKRTATGFRDLMANPKEVPGLLRQIRGWRATLPRDFVECNVYLGHFIHQLKTTFPDATLVHLHRDSRAVARSLRQRGWYDTPEDDRHPSLDVPEWDRMTQVEKICRYIGATNEAIRDAADHHIALEDIAGDADVLLQFLRTIGLRVLLPDLFRKRHPQVVDPIPDPDVEPVARWPARERAVFHAILDPVQRDLGYTICAGPQPAEVSRTALGRVDVVGTTLCFEDSGQTVFEPPYVTTRCTVSRSPGRMRLEVFPDRKGHAHLRYGSGPWSVPDSDSLLPVEAGGYYRLEVHTALGADLRGRLHVLQYDKRGRVIKSPHIRELPGKSRVTCVPFRPHERAVRQGFALYFPQNWGYGVCEVKSIRLFRIEESRSPW